MASATDSIIYSHFFSTPESSAIWSDVTRIRYHLLFEASLAKVQAELGIIPREAATQIVRHCRTEEIDLDELSRQSAVIGSAILPLVTQIVAKVNTVDAGLGEWVHWGTTTQDVTDTATILQLRDTLLLIETSLNSILSSLRKLCSAYKATPMAARSNLQQAVPMSFGFKMARLLATFQRHETRLAEIRSRLLVLEFGGAVGTLATISDGLGFPCQEKLAAELGLAVPEIAWHTERDRIAEVGSFFALLTATCAKFALDTKLLMQTEVAETSEPFVPHRGSSSTMPQKRNPVGCAYISGAAATVRQLSASLFEAVVADHERSTGPWQIEWIVLPQICTLSHAIMRHTADLLADLEVHPEEMLKNLQITRGAIVSEAVMMALGKTLGRSYAHDLVYDLCQRAVREDRPLVELLADTPEVVEKLGRTELEKLCDPTRYLGLSVEMTERVLAKVE